VFFTDVPSLEQEHFCLQVEPSSMPYWNSKSTSNSTEISRVSIEKEGISWHDALGQFSGSDEALPEMHLFPKVRPVSRSRLPKELMQLKPSNSNPP
jgi:hypothetical protein